jgi:hypothetical protein
MHCDGDRRGKLGCLEVKTMHCDGDRRGKLGCLEVKTRGFFFLVAWNVKLWVGRGQVHGKFHLINQNQ